MVRNDIILEMGYHNDESGYSKVKKIDWQGKKKNGRKTTDRKPGTDAREFQKSVLNVTMSIGP